MSLLHSPHTLHNKENSLHSSSCLPSFITKPTLSGLGRSPRKKSTSVHGTKPYARSASVHKPTKSVESGKVKMGKTRPAPLDLTAVKKHVVEKERVKIGEINIPLSLPKINVPMVPHLDEFFDTKVPFEYVRTKLLPRLSGFGIVSAQFRPYPSLSIPPHVSHQQGHRPSMAFAVPSILNGVAHPHLAAKLRGREPDICLAISKQGDTAMKAPASLVPINQLVFASQCYHWPRLMTFSPSRPVSEVDSPLTSMERSPSPELQSIKEEEEEPVSAPSPTEAGSDYNLTDPVYAESEPIDTKAAAESFPSTAPHHAQLAPQGQPWLDLPIHSLPLPSPETYSILHNLLHFTHSPSPSTFSPLQNLIGMELSELHKLHNVELMRKLSIIHGVWKNCWYLGIGDEKIWMGMRDAWGAVVGIVAERSKRVGGDVSMDN